MKRAPAVDVWVEKIAEMQKALSLLTSTSNDHETRLRRVERATGVFDDDDPLRRGR